MDYCSHTLQPYVFNLTYSYAEQRNEAAMMATSVVMFILAALFFILNLFSAFSDISAFLVPSIRLFLSTSLSLFLPVMSYLFSEAKENKQQQVARGNNGGGQMVAELSLRARTILTWMLLVELLRKKVEAIFSREGMRGYAGTAERASRIAWMGYLVFYNIRGAGTKAFYGTLWVLAAAKLVQRFVTTELEKRSFAYGKNPQLVASYMTQMLSLKDGDDDAAAGSPSSSGGVELLKRCKYVVMGEEGLKKKAGTDGYHLVVELTEEAIDSNNVVTTVGKIWKLAESGDELLGSDPRLKRLCLSFALYKLLRRRLEDFAITDSEARNCHDLVFKGLCQEDADANRNAVVLFQVLNDEVQFLCEYYHSVLPVVFATPFFFLVNYVMFPVVVAATCVLAVILGGHGDVGYAFRSLRGDNYGVSVGVVRIVTCLLGKMNKSPAYLFAAMEICVTLLLFLSFAYEQVWEFLVFVFSNWFLVSLLCSYASMAPQQQGRASRLLRWVIRGILWARHMLLHQPNVCFKQFSVLWFCRLCRPTKAVPREAKKAIMERLVVSGNGRSSPLIMISSEHHQRRLMQLHEDGNDLSWAFDIAGGVSDVMLTWHIATVMLETEEKSPPQGPQQRRRKAATALSAYCAYLVAFRPELLPDDKDGTERLYKDMKEELRKEMGCWSYYCSPPRDRLKKLKEVGGRPRTATMTVMRKGARLGKILIDKYEAAAAVTANEEASERVWQLLADVWTDLLLYAAPAGSELHVKAHKEALEMGGEFMTMLWALATHTGIARRPVAATPAAPACV